MTDALQTRPSPRVRGEQSAREAWFDFLHQRLVRGHPTLQKVENSLELGDRIAALTTVVQMHGIHHDLIVTFTILLTLRRGRNTVDFF